MTLYKVTTHKRLEALNGEQWVNTYYIDALGPNTALDAGELIAGYEMAVTASAVVAWRVSIKELPDGPTGLRAISVPGEIASDPVNLVPMFNTVRVVLTDTLERSESKYLRACIFEANVNGFNISNELRDAIIADYADPLVAVLGLRGPQGETITGASVQQLIQMRQLGWHRRSRPGFKRGWVPV